MLNLSKVSSGSGELIEIDISSVFAERSSERSSPFLSLRIGLLRKALRALDAGYSIGALCRALCKCRFLSAAARAGALWRALRCCWLLPAAACWRALWRAHCCCWLLPAAVAVELSAERSARDLVFRRAPRSLLSFIAVSYSDWSSLSSAPRAI